MPEYANAASCTVNACDGNNLFVFLWNPICCENKKELTGCNTNYKDLEKCVQTELFLEEIFTD